MASYVAFEGVDGAGKSTVATAVAARLEQRGNSVVLVREPGGTPLGEGIRRLLLNTNGAMAPWAEAALFAAQRAELAAQVIRPALARGDWVISDRSYYSSLAYQGGGRGLGVDRVRIVNEMALAGVVPDLVVVLRIEPDRGLQRQRQADRISTEGIEFQRRVAATYSELAAAEPHRVVMIDATGEISAVVDRVMSVIGP